MYQEYVTLFICTDSKHVNPAIASIRLDRFGIFFLSEMFLFFPVEDNGILVEYTYSF